MGRNPLQEPSPNTIDYREKGKLVVTRRRVPVWSWIDLKHVLSALVFCLLILGWIVEAVEASVADLTKVGSSSELEMRVLRLGQELFHEKLPFKDGAQCIYEILDLKESHSYEVKISYPASIPASFSIEVLPEHLKDSISSLRKLLNTEKTMFHVNQDMNPQNTSALIKRRVLVTVRPAGVLAKPHVHEQLNIIYNIVVEEVVFSIPIQAFWVGCLAFLTILASVIASQHVSCALVKVKPIRQVQ